MEGFTGTKTMTLTSAILLCILSVTVEATTEECPLLEAVFVVKDSKTSDHLKVTCPGTQEDDIYMLISKSQTSLNFSRLAVFKSGFPCEVDEWCQVGIPSYCKIPSYCGYDAIEKQVFAILSRQITVESYMCHYLKNNENQLYLIVEESTTETDVYKKVAIAVSCILGCFLLGVFAVLAKRCRAGNYSLVGTNLCCLIKTKTRDSVTTGDDSVCTSQRFRRNPNEDVMDMETCFSEIANAEAGKSKQ